MAAMTIAPNLSSAPRRVAWLVGLAALLGPLALAPIARAETGVSAASGPSPKAYIGLFKDNAVAVFDTGSEQVVGTIPVPAGPHGLVVTPDGRTVYVSSDGASTVSVIDTDSDQVTGSIEVGTSPHGLAMTPDGSRVLAAVFGTSQVAFIDTGTNRVVAQVPVPQPHNIAITPDGQTAFVAAQQAGATGLVVLDIPSASQVASIPLDKAPRALSVSPDGQTLLFTLAGSDAVQVLDVASRQVVGQVPVGASPHYPLFTPDGSLGLVVSQGPGTLDFFRPGDPASDQPITVGTMPHWIGLSGDGGTAYVTNEGSDNLSVVDLGSRSVVATVPVGHAPRKIVVQPAQAAGAIAAALADARVSISGFAFSPANIMVAPGQAVVFANGDAVAHTVTSADGQWDSGEIAPGTEYRLVLDRPGSYAYHCSIHPFMQGVVTVQAPS